MEIKKIKQDETKLVLEISGINEAEANTLRRSIIAETPTMAIEEVEIIKNDSALYDEILSHRLGLIPLTTPDAYNLPERCSCKGNGCAKCQTTLTLEAKGPCTIYSRELVAKDPNVKSVYEDIPIAILTENQEVKLVATAMLGKGKEHTKFSPGIVIYKHKPILKINNDSKLIEKYKEVIPEKALKNNKLDESAIIENNLYEAIESISPDLISVSYEKDKFIFTIESFGQLEPKDMIKHALEEFDYKLDEFAKKLKSAKQNNIKKLASKIKKSKIKKPAKEK
jgi:DNA-directed RNA polymerase subunit D